MQILKDRLQCSADDQETLRTHLRHIAKVTGRRKGWGPLTPEYTWVLQYDKWPYLPQSPPITPCVCPVGVAAMASAGLGAGGGALSLPGDREGGEVAGAQRRLGGTPWDRTAALPHRRAPERQAEADSVTELQ